MDYNRLLLPQKKGMIVDKPITIESLLALKKSNYGMNGLERDLELGNFSLGERVKCEGCGDLDCHLLCLHHYLCLECAGGAKFHCQECNPSGKLYLVVRDKLGILEIEFN